MTERELREAIDAVRAGALTRRDFLSAMLASGLTAGIAAQLLAHAGIARAQAAGPAYKPAKRGGGGALKVLWWQAPTLLNPHFSVGAKDTDACRIFYEPLACWDGDGNMVPVLAAEIPSLDNGGVSRDGRTVIWPLKRNVLWHDGRPFTSADVVFTAEFASDPATATTSIGIYRDAKVSAVDPYTVRVDFNAPTPFWANPFVSSYGGQVLPKHLFEGYRGARSREAPTNLKPVGTGPYRFVDFTPGDMVKGALNPSYHQPNRPHFDTIELKGGGDAVSAARAVLQTGEYDFAWNLQVEDEILTKLEQGGKGRVAVVPSADIEYLMLNCSDPWTEVEGERSSARTRHPLLSDPAVREALSLLVDRASVQQYIYGRAGIATSNMINSPARFRSGNTRFEFNVDKANDRLERAGWRRGPDGIRAKDGKKLRLVFQTSVNQPRQKTQAIIKQACQRAGIDVELKAVVASAYFSSDVSNPDTAAKFYADLEMHTQTVNRPDPRQLMRLFLSSEIAQKANKWQGLNIIRWSNPDYDEAYEAADHELDPVKRAALFIRMNDILVGDGAVVPLVARTRVSATSERLRAPKSGFDSDLFALQDWYREA